MAYTVSKLTDYSEEALEEAVREALAALGQEADELVTLLSAASVPSENKNTAFKAFRDRWMARKNGLLTQINDLWLKGSPKEAKRGVGARVNELKPLVEAKMAKVQQRFVFFSRQSSEALASLASLDTNLQLLKDPRQQVDVSLPGVRRPIGAEHPVIKTTNEMVRVFQKLGYSVADGPVVETDYYNFEALNFPPNHPARDTQDTLFIAGQQSKPQRERLLLRTHTSPVQIRTMEKMRPPIRIVIPGTVHRNDPPDASHSPMFHQIEGLAVDTNITFGDLKGTLDHAMKEFFGSGVKTSFRPSFFPFTEPSAELDISCLLCGGSGCPVCKRTGWVELLGSGMIDPSLYGFVGYDPEKVSGFAFGTGADRLALMKYGINDIQLLWQGDKRFLRQYR